MEERKIQEMIKILTPKQQIEDAEITCVISPTRILLNSYSTGVIEIKKINDFFTGLILIREQLEPLGYRFLCNGARKDLHPTPMGMQMGMGLSLFPIDDIINAQSKLKNAFPLFGYAPLETVSVVKEQEEYYNSLFYK